MKQPVELRRWRSGMKLDNEKLNRFSSHVGDSVRAVRNSVGRGSPATATATPSGSFDATPGWAVCGPPQLQATPACALVEAAVRARLVDDQLVEIVRRVGRLTLAGHLPVVTLSGQQPISKPRHQLVDRKSTRLNSSH